MTAGQYVRLAKGEFVCQRVALQGVVAHLHDLARHLENLIPDEDVLDKITRSRDFAGGFTARAEREEKPAKKKGGA